MYFFLALYGMVSLWCLWNFIWCSLVVTMDYCTRLILGADSNAPVMPSCFFPLLTFQLCLLAMFLLLTCTFPFQFKWPNTSVWANLSPIDWASSQKLLRYRPDTVLANLSYCVMFRVHSKPISCLIFQFFFYKDTNLQV